MGADAVFRRMALADVEGVWRPLLTGLACAIAGIALRFALTGLFTNAPGLSVLYPFVVLAALWGGWRSGAVALAAGLAGVWAATAMPGAADVFPLALGLYLIVGAFLILVSAALRGAIRRLDASLEARRAADARLGESENRFRIIADSAPVMLWMGDAEGRGLYLNRMFREFWGPQDPEALAGRGWLSMAHPDDREALAAAIEAGSRSEAPFQVEARLQRADGDYRLVRATVMPRFDTDQTFRGIIGVAADITDAQAAQTALQDSEARFRLVSEAAPVMLWMSDAEGRCVHLNRAQREFWGAPEDLQDFDWSDLLHPEDRQRVVDIASAAARDETGFSCEARFRRADGRWRMLRTDASARFDGDGRFLGQIGVNVDITDAREAETALRESEERFRAMADTAPAPVWVSGPGGGIDFVNQATKDFFGGEGPLGQAWIDRVHPEDRDRAVAVRNQAWDRRQPFTFEARFQNAAGEWRWLKATTRPRFDPGGELVGYVGIAFDVTAAREAEDALRAQNDRSRFLLDLGDQLRELDDPEAIMAAATSALGRELDVDRVGYGEVEPDQEHVVVGADWTRDGVRTAAGRYRMIDFGPRLLDDLKARVTVAARDVRTDPRTRESAAAFEAMDTRAFIRAPLVRGSHFDAFLFVHAPEVRDWTRAEVDLAEQVAERTWAEVERARAEDALRESEARFRDIADTAPVLIWVTAKDRTRSFINQAYAAYYGHTYAEALTADWRTLLHPDDVERIQAESLAGEASGEPFSLEARYRRADGEYRWLKSFSRPRLSASGEVIGFVGVAFDVTEARRAEEDLKRINELLEERVGEALAEKAKAEADLMHAQRLEAVGRLTGGVAHDFNNLLTVIIGALDMVLRSPDDPARRQRLGEAALAAARRGERLTHQLLAFSRRQTLRPEPCDLNALIRESEPLLRRAVGEAVGFELRLVEGGAHAHIDPAQFEAALLNLVVNARDAVSDGGCVRVETDVRQMPADNTAELEAGDYVRITVSDDGEGMTEDVMQRVFEPFFTTKPVGKGTGLGLSQVYGFVRQSGGGVSIASTPGRGSEISLYLPALGAGARDHAPREEPALHAPAVAGRSVLLVEDDPAVAEVALELLEGMGLQVQRAASGLEALHMLERRRFDLMLTDVVMPGGVNGVDLARRAADADPDMRILLTSGYAGEAVDAALAKAPWPFLRKPYSATELGRQVGEALHMDDA